MHVRAAIRNGLTPDEIGEAILHTALYAGLPAANAAFKIAERYSSRTASCGDRMPHDDRHRNYHGPGLPDRRRPRADDRLLDDGDRSRGDRARRRRGAARQRRPRAGRVPRGARRAAGAAVDGPLPRRPAGAGARGPGPLAGARDPRQRGARRCAPTTTSRRRSTCATPTTTASRSTPTVRASCGTATSTRMGTDPLDVEGLLGVLDDPATADWETLPGGTIVGHTHLQVASIPDTLAFYRDLLEFEEMVTLGSQATFLSAGGYHHHLGGNTWNSLGAARPRRARPRSSGPRSCSRTRRARPPGREGRRCGQRSPSSASSATPRCWRAASWTSSTSSRTQGIGLIALVPGGVFELILPIWLLTGRASLSPRRD